ncbi:MAG TPA: hypothetical protein VGK09_03405 [Rhodocyclaceae bacterium]|jgi:hypothetical protein
MMANPSITGAIRPRQPVMSNGRPLFLSPTNMTKNIFLAVAIFLGASLAVAEPIVNVSTGLSFPDSIAGYERVGVTDFESKKPGVGFSYTYRSAEGVSASIYVFNLQLAQIPSDIDSPLIAAVRKAATDDIAQVAATRGYSLRLPFSATASVKTSKGVTKVTYDMFRIPAAFGGNTFTWIWPARNHIFKIRLTPSASGELNTELMQEFYQAVVRLSIE